VGFGIAGTVAEERLVQHHAERAWPIPEVFLQPRELLSLLIGVSGKELRVETDDLPRS
jgi:hypothetical protein